MNKEQQLALKGFKRIKRVCSRTLALNVSNRQYDPSTGESVDVDTKYTFPAIISRTANGGSGLQPIGEIFEGAKFVAVFEKKYFPLDLAGLSLDKLKLELDGEKFSVGRLDDEPLQLFWRVYATK